MAAQNKERDTCYERRNPNLGCLKKFYRNPLFVRES